MVSGCVEVAESLAVRIKLSLAMNTLSEADFLRWASANGMELNPQYPHAKALSFTSDSESRFWCVPSEPHLRPHFLSSLLEFMENWKSCYVWRHLGNWPDPKPSSKRRINDLVEERILRGLGLPFGTAEVVQFERAEVDRLLTLLFSTTIFGWCSGDDLLVVPDHARQILQTDHHGVIHVSFRDAADVQDWISKMAARAFNLPDELPDETFKRPTWLPENPQ
jgi:hypothetical protein